VRETDTVARFGGDEFVVILGELAMEHKKSEAQALLVAEKILVALAAPYVLSSTPENGTQTVVEHRCTASIGIALFNARQAAQDDVLKWADAAMYQAKTSGRNVIRVYAPA
jgi:diguanylate cyclase (GGDEF)-like protein